jgi:hypothetical protein
MQLSFAFAALALLAAASAIAQVDFAPDITAPLGSAPSLVVNDHNLAHDDAAGGVTGYLIPAGALPANVQIEGYHALAGGNSLLALDITTALPGLPPGSPAEPRDVVELDPLAGTFSTYFDGAAAGVPANARIDAVSLDTGGDLQLSFDISVTLPGVGAIDDEDVVTYSAGVFAMAFDGSAAGVATAQDVDAVQTVTGPAGWRVSFDTSGTVGAVTFDDEDVVRYDSGLATYAMDFDGSVSDPADWPRADLDALPEPDLALAVASGAALLAGLCRIRRAPGSPSRR